MNAGFLAVFFASCLLFSHQASSADTEWLFRQGARPARPTLVLSGEIQPDDPLFAKLVGAPSPVGIARPLRFELAAPFELPPPSEAALQRHRAAGGTMLPDDPRPPSGSARNGTVRLNLVYCGWLLLDGAAVPGDLAFRYEFSERKDESPGWRQTAAQWRRLEPAEIEQCRDGGEA